MGVEINGWVSSHGRGGFTLVGGWVNINGWIKMGGLTLMDGWVG